MITGTMEVKTYVVTEHEVRAAVREVNKLMELARARHLTGEEGLEYRLQAYAGKRVLEALGFELIETADGYEVEE